jgi:HK97 gp10 family phage protein
MTRLLNLAKLDRKLKRLPEVAKVEIKAGMEAAADEIIAMMKSLVAVDSGDLRESIGWTWGKAPKGSLAVAAVKSSLGGDLTLTIYAGSDEAYYARWVEFGTQPHSLVRNASAKRGLRQNEGRAHQGTRAQPFFYVSWRANKRSAKRLVRKGVRDAAKKVAAGG